MQLRQLVGPDEDAARDATAGEEGLAAMVARGVPLVSAGDDRYVRLWSVEGVAGRGRVSGADAKRRRSASSAAADAMEDEDDEEDDEPGFRALAATRLRHKPNGVAAAADPAGSGRAVLCVATTGEAVEVLSI